GGAPDIPHLGIANPMGGFWWGAMMLENVGERDAAAAVMTAVEATTARGIGTVPGQNGTREIATAILSALG
ncbi:MAG: isocitrate/isopropylmalate family dehydrogenase, partial [Bosea sp. (in: a-proteobacteria)]|uniref:isocitrate/isopropylmalate family dehydrogenase n=1 Tax=Bosea sp. (in: a-proteobacteria) TaxID=1871050 RepID=UPI003F7B91C9